MKNNIVDQSYWNQSYTNYEFRIADNNVTREFDRLLEEIGLLPEFGSSCFEVGCYPGGYLAYFGKKYGYVVNGVDLTDQLNENLSKWLVTENIKVGKIERDDFSNYINSLYKDRIVFDFVYSCGFIEHFKNYNDVLLEHDKILKPNGLLLITTPNFRGAIQNILHRLVDKENLKRHVVAAMNPGDWEKVLCNKGYDILYKGYFGGFEFWSDVQKRNLLQKVLNRIMTGCSNKLKSKHIKNCSAYSPYCILLAKKSGEQ